MYPRAWFDTYWRGSLKMEVFIAMSFAEEFNPVWKHAIVPAIQEDLEGGKRYLAHRVDTTTLSGSIVTEIFDGVAHAKLVFADISVMPTGPCAGQRNGNVMYEVGLATAIRPETDIVIVKSDDEDINFDLLQIRVFKYPKNDPHESRKRFAGLLSGALKARENAKSLLTQYTWSLLDADCLGLMHENRNATRFGLPMETPFERRLAVRRLLELNIVRCEYHGGTSYSYAWTDFGKAVLSNPNIVQI